MKKIFTIIYLLCMVSTFSYAQNFRYGFTGGVNLSKPMGDIEPQCQAGLLLGAKGELGIPSAIKGFYTEFGLHLSAKGYKMFYATPVNGDERHYTENLNYLVVPVHIGYKIECSKSVSLFANGARKNLIETEKSFTLKVTFLVINMGIKDSIGDADSMLV